MVRIIFYRSKCIGCNGCVEAAPERWRISRKDGKGTLIGAEEKKGIYQTLVDMDEYAKNQRAATNCPAKIIRLEMIAKK